MRDEQSPVVTFQRRRKGRQTRPTPSLEQTRGIESKRNDTSAKATRAVEITSDSSTPLSKSAAAAKGANGNDQKEVPGAWRKARKKQPSQREQARYASHVSHLREQFAEVDAFELIAETPSPEVSGRDTRGVSMISYDKRERSVSKLERSGSMLGRVSSGLHDALVWLNKSVLRSGGGKKNRLERPSMDRVGVALDFGAVGAGGEDIFTIGEEDNEEASDPGADEQIGEPIDEKINEQTHEQTHEKINEQTHSQVDRVAPRSSDRVANEPTDNLDLSRLQIGDDESLRHLLRLCNQEDNPSKIPSMDALLKRLLSQSSPAASKRTFEAKKVGEGTFGEAFKTDQDVVFKIVPFETLPSQKTAGEILSEAEVSLKLTHLRHVPEEKSITAITNVTGGFAETYAVGVCRGAYAQQLIAEWNRWNEIHRSENDPVDVYGASQLYAVFVQANGGTDLESFKPRNFDEVKSILLQVALTLAVAENACQFEHRDLHWGNVLVKREGPARLPQSSAKPETDPNRLECTMNDVEISVDTSGVRVTLIDFTLSRLTKGTDSTDAVYCDLSADPEIFNGPQGDLQADAYRRMRDTVDEHDQRQQSSRRRTQISPWEGYVPRTNAIWLEYLAGIMLHHKGKWKKAEKDALAGFMERAREDGESAESLVWDSLFAGCWE